MAHQGRAEALSGTLEHSRQRGLVTRRGALGLIGASALVGSDMISTPSPHEDLVPADEATVTALAEIVASHPSGDEARAVATHARSAIERRRAY